MGPCFYIFAYVMLATRYVTASYLPFGQTALKDTIHARGINRVRHYYLEIAPQLEPYFIHTTHDYITGMIVDMGIRPSQWQTYLTSSTMLSFIASVMLGVLVGRVPMR